MTETSKAGVGPRSIAALVAASQRPAWSLLIVEDDPLDATLMIEWLRTEAPAWTTRVVASGPSFEAALSDPPDLILCDFKLPGFDAFGALDVLRRRALDHPLIVVSGVISDEQAVECMRVGAADYLSKDRLDRLVPAIERAMADHARRTELRRAGAAAAERARLLAAIFDATTHGLVVIDGAGRTVESNAIARALLDTTAAVQDGPATHALEDLFERIVSGGPERGEIELADGEGATRTVTYAAVVGFMAGRTLVVLDDVTSQRALEARSIERQRLESLGRLAGGIAHDFNNILAAIVTSAELGLIELADDAPGRPEVAGILHAADQASELIRQIMAYSRRQMLQPERVDVAWVVADMEAILRRPPGSRVTLSIDPGDEPALVFVDRAQLRQVIMNLVVNAGGAMPDGGHIAIRVGHETIGIGSRHESGDSVALRPGRYARLEVSDTGEGMDAEASARVFEPFFTTKGVGRGTGLGLAIAYDIVRQSEGAIRVHSRPGEGSQFVILLPALDSPTEAAGRSAAHIQDPAPSPVGT